MEKICNLDDFMNTYGDRALSRITGSAPFKAYGLPDEQNFWKYRENFRFTDFTEKKYHLIQLLADFDINFDEYFPRPSCSDQNKIAFTPSAEYGLADRQIVMRPGKFLRTIKPDASPHKVKNFANRYNALYGTNYFRITNDPDKIRYVYRNGPHSCMSHAFTALHTHPTAVYAGPDTAVAYMETEAGNIQSRTVLNTIDKHYVRIYGDPTALVARLRDDGYAEGTLEGCRLLAIPLEEHNEVDFIMPYLDGVQTLEYDGKYFYVSYDGTTEASTTDGYVNLDNTYDSTCDECGERTHEDNLLYSNYHDMSICQNCADYEFTHAIVGTGSYGYEYDHVRTNDVIYIDCLGETVVEGDEDLLADLGVGRCDLTEEYCLLDDLTDVEYARNTCTVLTDAPQVIQSENGYTTYHHAVQYAFRNPGVLYYNEDNGTIYEDPDDGVPLEWMAINEIMDTPIRTLAALLQSTRFCTDYAPAEENILLAAVVAIRDFIYYKTPYAVNSGFNATSTAKKDTQKAAAFLNAVFQFYDQFEEEYENFKHYILSEAA